MSIDASYFITQSLAPAFILSGVGLLTVGLHNRLLIMAGRIRDLNRETRDPEALEERLVNIERQTTLVLQRIHLMRSSLFLLYGAMGCMVLTALFILFHELWGIFPEGNVPVWSFLLGLLFIFIAISLESVGVMLNLKIIELDMVNSQAIRKLHTQKAPKTEL